MAYGKLSREQYHRLVSNRIVAIYAMLPDNEIRNDILKIMEDSIDAHYPSASQNASTSDEALPIGDVVKSDCICVQTGKQCGFPCFDGCPVYKQ